MVGRTQHKQKIKKKREKEERRGKDKERAKEGFLSRHGGDYLSRGSVVGGGSS